MLQGLAALLVQGLSGCSPEEVARLPPDWIAQMGLQQSLTPSRNNGFFNMYGLMHQQAVQLCNGEAAPHPAQVMLWGHMLCCPVHGTQTYMPTPWAVGALAAAY